MLGQWLMHLLFPPRCRGCGEPFDIFLPMHDDPLPLCSRCLELWQAAKQSFCATCGAAVSTCACMPPLLRQSGCSALVKAVAYHPKRHGLPERLILRCKRVRDRALFSFFAADMRLSLWQALEQITKSPEAALISYIPRRAAAAATSGVDQGEELAKALGKALDIPMIRTLVNHSSVAQKTLHAAERQENAKRAISLPQRHAAAVRGKTIVLVDDITTLGATLGAATECLLEAGAAQVLACTVAMTEDP